MAQAAKKEDPGKALVEQKGGAVAAYDYGADAGAGFENQTSEDVSIPFLVILQPGSPEVQSEAEDAPRPGFWINKSTGDVTKGGEGIGFIPACTQHLLVEWVNRDKGGGFIGQHAIDSTLAKQVRSSQPLGAYTSPDNPDHDLIETFYVYGVQFNAGGAGWPAVIAFSSTHIKPYKDWQFRARSVQLKTEDGRMISNLPLFAHRYRLTTLRQEKNGNTWFIPVVKWDGADADEARLAPTDDLYVMARGVREAINSGAMRAATEGLSSSDGGGGNGADPGKAPF